MAEAFRQVFKAEGSLGQSMMFQPTAVTAARAKEAPSENAAADRGRSGGHPWRKTLVEPGKMEILAWLIQKTEDSRDLSEKNEDLRGFK